MTYFYILSKIIILIIVLLFLVISPVFICYFYDFDHELEALTRSRYDEKNKLSIKNRIYKIIFIIIITIFILTILLSSLFLWLVM